MEFGHTSKIWKLSAHRYPHMKIGSKSKPILESKAPKRVDFPPRLIWIFNDSNLWRSVKIRRSLKNPFWFKAEFFSVVYSKNTISIVNDIGHRRKLVSSLFVQLLRGSFVWCLVLYRDRSHYQVILVCNNNFLFERVSLLHSHWVSEFSALIL